MELHHHTSSFALFCSAPVYLCFYNFWFKSSSWAVSGVFQLSVSCLAFHCETGKLENICRQGQSSLLVFRGYLQSFIRLGPIPTPILDALSTDLSPRASYKLCLYYYLELSHCRNPLEREVLKSTEKHLLKIQTNTVLSLEAVRMGQMKFTMWCSRKKGHFCCSFTFP